MRRRLKHGDWDPRSHYGGAKSSHRCCRYHRDDLCTRCGWRRACNTANLRSQSPMGYSAFLSHNSNDKPFVRRLASELRAAGVKVWVDEAELRVGDSLFGRPVLSSSGKAGEYYVRNCGTPLFNRSVSPQLHSCGIAEFRTPAAVAGEAATPSKRKLSLTFLHSRIGQNSRERPVTIGVGALFRDAQSLLTNPATSGSDSSEMVGNC